MKIKEYHEGLIAEYEKLLVSLNPEFAEKKAQQTRIDSLESQLASLMEMNKQLLSRLGAETSNTNESNENLGA